MDRRQDGVAAAEFADHSAPSQGKVLTPRAGYAEAGTTMRSSPPRASRRPPPLAARKAWTVKPAATRASITARRGRRIASPDVTPLSADPSPTHCPRSFRL